MAIFLTLGITISIYMILALIAVSAPDRNAIVASGAPMAVLYEQISGHSGTWLAAVAAIAMINGILVQMIMVARVLYGMANEGLLPQLFAYVSPKTATPVYATVLTGLAIFVLCLFFPLVTMAKTTSVLTLLVFSVVNLSFFVLARRHEKRWFRIFSLWGVMAAGLSMALLAATLVN
jgi:amino acid transporter